MAGDFKDRLNVSLQAVAQVLLVCGLGVWLAKRHGFNRQAIAAVSGVNWHALIPALMFSSIVGAVTPSGLVLLWPMLLMSLLHIVLGVIPAWLLGWAARLPNDMLFFTIMTSSLPNCGNLPWLFMPAIIRYFAPADAAADQIQYMVGLVSVYTIITILVTLTVPFFYKRPPETLVLPRRARQQHPEHHSNRRRSCPGPDAAAPDSERVLDPSNASNYAAAGVKTCLQQQLQDADPDIGRCSAAHVSGGLQQCDQQVVQPADGGSRPNLVVVASHSTLADSCISSEPEDTDLAAAAPPPADGLNSSDLPARSALHMQHPPAAAAHSFTSYTSSSQLLRHGRQLLGSFSRGFRHSFTKNLQRSNSLVQLVWDYPRGWHRNRHKDVPDVPDRDLDASGLPSDLRNSSCWRYWPKEGPLGNAVQKVLSCYRVVMAHPAVNLPLGATIAGIACAAVGPVRSVLVDDLAPLHWLWLGLSWIGAAAAPLATLQIGAELVQGAPVDNSMQVSKRAQWSATIIAIIVKLIVVPLINVVLLRNAGLATLVPASDTVYQLLLLVEGAVPAAVTLLVVCSRVYPDIRPLSKMLFWQYVASLITLPAFLVWFMYLLDI